MSQHWDYLTAKDNQRQVIVWTVAVVTLPAAGAFLWWLSEKGYNNLAPYRVSLAHKPTPMKQSLPLVAKYACHWHLFSDRFVLYSINIDQAPFQATLRGCWQDMLTDAAVRPLLDCLQHQASCLGKAFTHVCTAQDANPSECIWMAALI